MENTVKGTNMMTEIIIGIVSIVVTIISIIVTLINTIQSCEKARHQKSNRTRQK